MGPYLMPGATFIPTCLGMPLRFLFAQQDVQHGDGMYPLTVPEQTRIMLLMLA